MINMKYKTYYLAFNSPLHLGNNKPESYEQSADYLRSDTIIAAVYASWAKMGHVEWIPVDGTPPFVVSSAFPYVGNCKDPQEQKKCVHFFPRPKLRLGKNEIKNGIVRKKVKKVQWLDMDYFEMLINEGPFEEYVKDNAHLHGKYLSGRINPEKYITRDLMQRVKISRNVENHEDSEPFYMERIFFKNAGLFFLAAGEELEKLDKALEFLQYEGFGTDRTVGNGFFDLKQGEIDINVPRETNLSMNLSLFIPESRENFLNYIDEKNTAFESIRRGGWITTEGNLTKEKKSVLMFTEGCVWKQSESILGKGNIDLTPKDVDLDHTIWRSGQSIFIPIKV